MADIKKKKPLTYQQSQHIYIKYHEIVEMTYFSSFFFYNAIKKF